MLEIEAFLTFLGLLGFGACHQRAVTTFYADGFYMPVCSRCTGIYIGFIISFILVFVIEKGLKSGIAGKKIIIALIAFFSIMVIDVFLSLIRIFPQDLDNIVRFITGFTVGWFLPLILLPLKNGVMFKVNITSGDTYLSGKKHFITWMCAGIIFMIVFLLTYVFRDLFVFYSVLSIAGLIVFLAELLTIMFFASIKRLRNSVSSRLKYAGFFVISIFMAGSFILISSFLKQLTSKYLHL